MTAIGNTCSIIIPTFNERENIIPLVSALEKSVRGNRAEIIIIDDNSPDRTWEIAEKLTGKNPDIKLIKRKKRGLPGAITEGIKQSKGLRVAWLDADFSHPPEVLHQMTIESRRSPVVIASRYLKGSADRRKEKLRVFSSWLLNKTARLMLGKIATDFTSGFIMIRKDLLTGFTFKGREGEYFIDLVCYLYKMNIPVKEIPYVSVSRKTGNSKTAADIFSLITNSRYYLWSIIKNMSARYR